MKTPCPDEIIGYRFGPCLLNIRELRLLHEGETLPAAPKVLETLRVLVERQGEVVTRSEITAQVWPNVFVEEGSLAQNIFQLRRLLESSFPDQKPIVTVPKRGYTFLPTVKPVYRSRGSALPLAEVPPVKEVTKPASVSATGSELEISSEALNANPEPPGVDLPCLESEVAIPGFGGATAVIQQAECDFIPAGALGQPSAIRPKWVYAAALACIAAVLIASFMRSSRLKAAISMAVGGKRVVTVWNFRDLDPTREMEWESAALANGLRQCLGEGKRLVVLRSPPLSASVQHVAATPFLEASAADLASMARETGSNVVIWGSYRNTEDTVQIASLVYDAAGEKVIGRFDRSGPRSATSDLLKGMGLEIRALLDGSSPPATGSALLPAAFQADRDAAALYAEGARRLHDGNLAAARSLLQQALALAPHHALAHASLSQVWTELGDDRKAVAEAELAWADAAQLPRERQLEVQASLEVARHHWAAAIQDYQAIVTLYPEVDAYRYALASAWIDSGQPRGALRVVDELTSVHGRAVAPKFRALELKGKALEAISDWNGALQADDAALAMASSRGDDLAEARLQAARANCLHQLGRAQEAEQALGTSIATAQKLNDEISVIRARIAEATLLRAEGKMELAQAVVEQSLAEGRKAGAGQLVVKALNTLGQIVRDRNDLASAQRDFAEALALAQTLGNVHLEARSLLNVANVQNNTGNPVAARSGYELALTKAQAIGDAGLLNIATGNLGVLDEAEGELPSAAAHLKAAIEANRASGQNRSVAYDLGHLVTVYREQGDMPRAERALSEQEELLRTMQDNNGLSGLRMERAELLAAQGQLPRALPYLQEVASSAQDASTLVRSARLLVPFWLQSGEREKAATLVERASMAAHRTLNQADYILPADLVTAQCKAASGEKQEAVQLLRSVRERAHHLRLLPLEIEAQLDEQEFAGGAQSPSSREALMNLKDISSEHHLVLLALRADRELQGSMQDKQGSRSVSKLPSDAVVRASMPRENGIRIK